MVAFFYRREAIHTAVNQLVKAKCVATGGYIALLELYSLLQLSKPRGP